MNSGIVWGIVMGSAILFVITLLAREFFAARRKE